MKNIHESTKKESKIYQIEILKLKHEKDNVEELLKALFNANFNKIQISSATDKEQQIHKLNTILEKEQGMKKIMTQDNIDRHDALGMAGMAAAVPEFFRILSVHR